MRPTFLLLAFFVSLFGLCHNTLAASHVTIDPDQVLVIDSKKVFPIGFTTPPPPDGKTPDGKNGIGELADADKKLGWNWTFWKRVLRPVIEEIGSKSPLFRRWSRRIQSYRSTRRLSA
jgi:hypothetical protein